MSRTIQISNEDIQTAKQLRDQTTTIAEYRKALSVIVAVLAIKKTLKKLMR